MGVSPRPYQWPVAAVLIMMRPKRVTQSHAFRVASSRALQVPVDSEHAPSLGYCSGLRLKFQNSTLWWELGVGLTLTEMRR